MSISDRFTRGWVAGACGGLIGGIISLLPRYLVFNVLGISDWAAILIYGRLPPFSNIDIAYAIIIIAGSTGVIGIIFAYLLNLINEENIYFKGWIVFLVPWGLVYLLTALAQTDGTLNLPVMTSLFNGISISILGLVSVFAYRLIKRK
jgi:hypothetical protein